MSLLAATLVAEVEGGPGGAAAATASACERRALSVRPPGAAAAVGERGWVVVTPSACNGQGIRKAAVQGCILSYSPIKSA